MTTISRKYVEVQLKRKGFRRDERHHHYFVYVTLSGKKTAIRTRTSHGSGHKDLGDSLLLQMAKQCGGLRKADFLQLLECTLSRRAFEKRIGTG